MKVNRELTCAGAETRLRSRFKEARSDKQSFTGLLGVTRNLDLVVDDDRNRRIPRHSKRNFGDFRVRESQLQTLLQDFRPLGIGSPSQGFSRLQTKLAVQGLAN